MILLGLGNVRICCDLAWSPYVREVTEIVNLYICQQMEMFHIARDWNVSWMFVGVRNRWIT